MANPADNELHAAVQPFDCPARDVQPLVRTHPPEARHDRTSGIEVNLREDFVTRACAGIGWGGIALWHHDNASARVVGVANVARCGLTVADHDIAIVSEQAIPVAIPAIRPFVRFEVVDRPNALHAAAARRTKKPVQPQQRIGRTRRALNAIRPGEVASPEVFGPVQVHGIDAIPVRLNPAEVDLEVVGDRNAVFRQRRMAQREIWVLPPRDTGGERRDIKESIFQLSSAGHECGRGLQVGRRPSDPEHADPRRSSSHAQWDG